MFITELRIKSVPEMKKSVIFPLLQYKKDIYIYVSITIAESKFKILLKGRIYQLQINFYGADISAFKNYPSKLLRKLTNS